MNETKQNQNTETPIWFCWANTIPTGREVPRILLDIQTDWERYCETYAATLNRDDLYCASINFTLEGQTYEMAPPSTHRHLLEATAWKIKEQLTQAGAENVRFTKYIEKKPVSRAIVQFYEQFRPAGDSPEHTVLRIGIPFRYFELRWWRDTGPGQPSIHAEKNAWEILFSSYPLMGYLGAHAEQSISPDDVVRFLESTGYRATTEWSSSAESHR